MLYVVLTMPTLNKAYLFIFIYLWWYDRLKLYKKDNGNALFTSHASFHQIYTEEHSTSPYKA